jgi:hypothetical protein
MFLKVLAVGMIGVGALVGVNYVANRNPGLSEAQAKQTWDQAYRIFEDNLPKPVTIGRYRIEQTLGADECFVTNLDLYHFGYAPPSPGWDEIPTGNQPVMTALEACKHQVDAAETLSENYLREHNPADRHLPENRQN